MHSSQASIMQKASVRHHQDASVKHKKPRLICVFLTLYECNIAITLKRFINNTAS
jgi:hypothetical protein